MIEPQLDACFRQPHAKIAQRLGEFLLARNAAREIELAADLRRGIEQGHVVAALGGSQRARHAGRTGADDGDLAPCRGRLEDQLGFATRVRIDQAGRRLALEYLVEARLVAADAGVDFVGASVRRLGDKVGVGEEWTRHRHHVGVAAREDRFGGGGIVDAVGRDQRNFHRALQPPRHPGEGGARHHRRDRRDARLVPADAGVDDRRTGGFDRLRQRDDLVPRAAAFDQIQHRQAVDDDEVRADRFAGATHDRDREADAVEKRAAPVVVAQIRLRRDELVDQVALRAHDLDAVVAGALRERRAARVRRDGPAHAPSGQRTRAKRRDRRLERRRRDGERMVGVAAAVQDLHRDPAAGGVHGFGHRAMLRDLPGERELRMVRIDPSAEVRARCLR